MRPAWRAALVVRASPAAAAAVAAEPWSSGLPPRPAEAFPGWTPKPPWTGAWSVTAAAADATAAGKASQTTAVVVSAELGSKLGIPARAPARHQLRSRLHLRVPRRHYPFTPPSPSSSPPCGPVPTFSASNPTLTPPRAQRRPLGVPVSAPPLLCSLGPFRPPTLPPTPAACRSPLPAGSPPSSSGKPILLPKPAAPTAASPFPANRVALLRSPPLRPTPPHPLHQRPLLDAPRPPHLQTPRAVCRSTACGPPSPASRDR